MTGVYVYGELSETATRKRRAYTYFLARSPFFEGVLAIVQDEHYDVYAVEEITLAEGDAMSVWRTFAVVKAMDCKIDGEIRVSEREWMYCVRIPGRLNGSGKPSCECFGYRSHQHCKHIDCIWDLCKRGQI